MIDDAIVTAIAARLTAVLARPADPLRPLRAGRDVVGWLEPARMKRLAAFPDTFDVGADAVALHDTLRDEAERSAAIDRVARRLAAEGQLTGWREERYAIATVFGAAPKFLLERAAARYFGVATYAAHVNGLVHGGSDDGPRMWIARRSPTKSIDPSLLDNLVGGGIATGQSVAATVVKEAREEAGIPAALAALARPAGAVYLCRMHRDGLQRETIFVHDLWLPPDLVPAGEDGEVVEHRLVSLDEAAKLIAQADGPDVVTADASLVILDCLLRHGAIAADATHYLALDALRHPSLAIEGFS